MVDDQVDARQQPAEVVRLHVDRGDAVEARELRRRDRLDLDVEQVGHPQVLRPRDALHRADDRGRARAAQHVAQREARGQRVGIGLVVQQDEHAVRVREVALVLLHAGARERSAELGRERGRQQLGQIEVRDFRDERPEIVLALAVRPRTDLEHVDEAAAGVADGRDHALQAAAAVVFDDDAGVGAQVGAEVGIDAFGVGHRDRHPVVDETPSQRAIFDAGTGRRKRR